MKDDPWIIKEVLPLDTRLVFDAMSQLRTDFDSVEDFVQQVDEVQRPNGYRLVAVLPTNGDPAFAVAGFRLGTSLSWGKYLYIEDLSTALAFRNNGFASRLLEWIYDEAKRLNCKQIHLDSGVGPSRSTAHRLYLNSRYLINAFHFVRDVL